jgi:hypothetical protein
VFLPTCVVVPALVIPIAVPVVAFAEVVAIANLSVEIENI